MSSAPKNSSSSPKSILAPIQGDTIWNGPIEINFVDADNTLEQLEFTRIASRDGYLGGYSALSSQWQMELKQAISVFQQYANIEVVFSNNLGANYLVGEHRSDDAAYWSDPEISPDITHTTYSAGFNLSYGALHVDALQGAGNDRSWNFLHEFGHALGLQHPHGNGGGTVDLNGDEFPPDVELPAPYTVRQTIMSYAFPVGIYEGSSFGMPVTPMALDIAAIQALYGANENANKGATLYKLTDPETEDLDRDGSDGSVTIGQAYYAIWDTSAANIKDEIKYEGSSSVLINLNDATLNTKLDKQGQEIIDELQRSAVWSTLNETLRNEIEDPNIHSGGYFSQVLEGDGLGN
jgi:hypothetical protein